MTKGIVSRAVVPFLAAAVFFGLAGAAPVTAQAEAMKVAGIFETPIEEPWVKQIHQALLKAQEELGIEYTWSESVKAADFARVMREFAEKDYELIMGDAFGAERRRALIWPLPGRVVPRYQSRPEPARRPSRGPI